ncbi:hypothetical protein THITH_11595 [Thioalkalivibrio paradoxus ARh 1]|uniref:Glutamate synthase domain-containing protein n=1 Tax=Thioalkalivibrio paradoxus ARh 1 TaxID=713585 RepID=W0DTL0_9GAMM|nr:hypothetical protein THITH_11595 [Thioalkalivibrio paradoxus ARh 1]
MFAGTSLLLLAVGWWFWPPVAWAAVLIVPLLALGTYDLRGPIRVIASGKILTGFHLVKNLAVGADLCSSARGMMFALGCVHSLICNTNRCPSGVATQDPRLYRGLIVADKAQRVAQFQAKTVHATAELIASAGLFHTSELNRTHIYRRVTQSEIRRYDRIYPYVSAGVLRDPAKAPEAFAVHLEEADPERFVPRYCLTRTDKPCGDPHRARRARNPEGGTRP